ncbi:MAG: cardiolipin synthase [Candidatus Saccharimonadales bacterium]
MNIDWNILGITFVAVDLLLKIIFLFYVPRGRRPSSAMAWLLAIFLLPYIGVIVFLLIGSPKLSRRRRGYQTVINHMLTASAESETAATYTLSPEHQERYGAIINQNMMLSKLPARYGNKLTIIDDYSEILASMVRDIDAAKHHVYLQYYAMALDSATRPIFQALEAAIGRGVAVYVLFDSYGSRSYKNYTLMKRELTRMGATWHPILPLDLRPSRYNRPDLRNHRKITVIDTHIAYIGSLNLIERSYERTDAIYYDELAVRGVGPIAHQATAVFAGDWYSECGEAPGDMLPPTPLSIRKKGTLAQLLPSGPAYENENNLQLFVTLLYAAKKRVVITNPYFVPEESLLRAVTSAVHRGVEVILINSEAKDQWMVGHAQRSYYDQLLRAGVIIYLHRAPLLLHSKHITIDDDIAVIGSSNMDIRSFQLNHECVVIAYDKKVVAKLQAVQTKNIAHSKRVTLSAWRKRTFMKNMVDSLMRLTSALQ